MIVEFIGCAGAGKTTIARMILERGVVGSRVLAMPDLVLDRPLLRRVTHPTAVNVAQEIGSFPFVLRSFRSDSEFLPFARRLLSRHARTAFDRFNGMRGIVRKVGMYELATSRASNAIVLSDEGTVLSAYNLFVMTDLDFGRREVDTFLGLVPLPDRVVYVTAPIASLVERAHSRATPRRQHRGRVPAEVELDVRRTIALFDLIASAPVLADRVLVVENADGDELARRRRADATASWLEGSSPGPEPARQLVGTLGPELGG